MTVKLSSLKADLTRETDGDWIAYPRWKGVRFRVSAFTKPAYLTARDELHQRIVKRNGGVLPGPDELRPLYARLYVDELLHGWEGFDVDFSPEKAVELLSNPEYRELVEAVEWCAGQVARIDVEYIEAAAKNSGPLSGGGSRGQVRAAG